MGKTLIITGLVIAAIGVVILLAGRLEWLSCLPGDIVIERPGFTFYLPITTCLIVSIFISLVLKIFNR
ncbi:MAG: DUF2905 domain-containing protein [Deltaproteobacteria bacterium]|nr:MAG: DUF2905 domain-containing protein [Deltaproteobacteria bacterium]